MEKEIHLMIDIKRLDIKTISNSAVVTIGTSGFIQREKFGEPIELPPPTFFTSSPFPLVPLHPH